MTLAAQMRRHLPPPVQTLWVVHRGQQCVCEAGIGDGARSLPLPVFGPARRRASRLSLARRLVDVLWALLRDGHEFTTHKPISVHRQFAVSVTDDLVATTSTPDADGCE